MVHEVIIGSCGHTLAVCRCPGQGPGPKPVRTVPRKCYACSNPPAAPVRRPRQEEQQPSLDASEA